MITDYEDKVAVITGDASGIGYALAEKCLNEERNAQVGFILVSFLQTKTNKRKL